MASGVHRLFSGPVPEKGTPQDRFRENVLGIPSSAPGKLDENAKFGNGWIGGDFKPQLSWPSQPPGTEVASYLKNTPATVQTTVPAPAVTGTPLSSTLNMWANPTHGGNSASRPAQPPPGSASAGQPPGVEAPRPLPQAPPPTPGLPVPQSNNSAGGVRAVSLLSQECQKRKFNPVWAMCQPWPNRYRCTVFLLNRRVYGDTCYATPETAKLEIAKQALEIIRKWPIPPKLVTEEAQPKVQPRSQFKGPTKEQPQLQRDKVPNPGIESAVTAKARVLKALTDVVNANGRDSRPGLTSRQHEADCSSPDICIPGRFADDVMATNAFLEGYRLGQTVRSPSGLTNRWSVDRPKDGRSRSRSPRPALVGPGQSTRSRSPLGRPNTFDRQRIKVESPIPSRPGSGTAHGPGHKGPESGTRHAPDRVTAGRPSPSSSSSSGMLFYQYGWDNRVFEGHRLGSQREDSSKADAMDIGKYYW